MSPTSPSSHTPSEYYTKRIRCRPSNRSSCMVSRGLNCISFGRCLTITDVLVYLSLDHYLTVLLSSLKPPTSPSPFINLLGICFHKKLGSIFQKRFSLFLHMHDTMKLGKKQMKITSETGWNAHKTE